ncbi:MAG: carboxyl transferase domain-containing protein [Oscillospiraceae bacterium]|nr:carboxyl transferase domain-containing protein [Oscillospiraceae bacterium]
MSFENGKTRLENELASAKESVARTRLQSLFDSGVFAELDRFAKNGDNPCEVVTAFGTVSGTGVYAFSQDSSILSGAMGRVQAAKIKRVYELAAKTGAPVVGIYDSKGAHMDEGMDALGAYGELILASSNISGVVPQISLVLGSCIGSAAILADLADVVVMSKTAELCVSSAFIVGDKDKLVGTAEIAAKNGTASIVAVTEQEAIEKAVAVMSLLPANNLSTAFTADYVPAVPTDGNGVDDLISAIADDKSFIELGREYGSCSKVGLARIEGNSVGVVATDSNKNEGKLCGNAADKIARFVRFCDAFSIPVVTMLDCAGFMGNKDAELNGEVKAIAKLTHAYAEATTPKITVIAGQAIGAAYIAMAGRACNADVVFAWPNAVVSSLETMTAVQLMYKDRLGQESRESLESEYINTVASPFTAASTGLIDDIILREETADRVSEALTMMESKRVSTMNKKHSNIPL